MPCPPGPCPRREQLRHLAVQICGFAVDIGNLDVHIIEMRDLAADILHLAVEIVAQTRAWAALKRGRGGRGGAARWSGD